MTNKTSATTAILLSAIPAFAGTTAPSMINPEPVASTPVDDDVISHGLVLGFEYKS